MRLTTRLATAVIAAAAWTNASFATSMLREDILTPGASLVEPAAWRIGQDIAIVDVAGTPSVDGVGSPNNAVLYVWIGPGNVLTGVGWDVTLQTVAPGSWRDDMVVWVSNTASPAEFAMQPGSRDGPGGPFSYSSDGIIKLEPIGLRNIFADTDGLIKLEFSENVDDAPGAIDGSWLNGSLFLQTARPIPVPAPPSSLAIGLIALAGTRSARRVA